MTRTGMVAAAVALLALAPAARARTTGAIARGFVARLAAHRARPPWGAGADLAVDHLIVDGDLFALHHHVSSRSDPRGIERLDLWQVAGGRIVRHWSVAQPVPVAAANAAGMGCGAPVRVRAAPPPGCAAQGGRTARAATLAVVQAYLAAGDGPLGHAGAVERFVSEDFVQHSAHIAQGKAALAAYFAARDPARAAAGRRSTTLHLLADGNLVLLHRTVVSSEAPRGTRYADIFRVAAGRIAEHWDVIEPIAPTRR